jgi:hypothetical protein
MRLIMVGVLAVTLAAPSFAVGQAIGGGSAGPGPPLGQRQPSAREMPPDPTNPQAAPAVASTREDRALERALKGICRGC